jgi:hypothetical protein
MAGISASVGETGKNSTADVAIVQLLLHLVKNSLGAPYYPSPYSGKYDAPTKIALTGFVGARALIEPGSVAPSDRKRFAGSLKK